jgi:hypothetical protein
LRFAALAALVVLLAYSHKVVPIKENQHVVFWINQVVDHGAGVRALLAIIGKELAQRIFRPYQGGSFAPAFGVVQLGYCRVNVPWVRYALCFTGRAVSVPSGRGRTTRLVTARMWRRERHQALGL